MITRPPPTAEALAAAARRRASLQASVSGVELIREHEKRQMFRRLIDPGIFRPNSKEVAMASLKTLSTIAENVLREPENPKYHSFKRENDTIKRRLIEPKGALEYAIALGFRPKVTDFQSYYVFNHSKLADLRVGAAILKEAIDLETQKEHRLLRNKEEEKAAAEAVAQNIKLAFLDDRKTKMLRDERERELRDIRDSDRGSQSASEAGAVPRSPPRDRSGGYTLASIDSVPACHD